MKNNYNPSVNIVRDSEAEFHYFPTPNSKLVVGQIVNDFKIGVRSFNIIGSYGTGKSSFLFAFEQSIRGNKRYFEPNFISKPKVDFVKIIGSSNSIIEYFANLFEVNTKKFENETIFSEIFNRYHSLGKENKILFLLIDEFGKFLEYASKYNPERELYFIQQLAEFCNNPKYNIILITTVHQGFESYANSLSSSQKHEWTKVKGRFREITFNEPVEQLLFVASEFIVKNFENKNSKSIIEKSLKLALSTKVFSTNINFLNEIAINLFPLDVLSANILTLSLQRYGQNERSLFSFLQATDHTGLSKFNKNENPFYNLSCVYDYLNFNFYLFLTSKYNPDFSAWASIRSGIEKVEREIIDVPINDCLKAIKTIGLLNLFSPSGSIFEFNFLSQYLEMSCGILNGKAVILSLENKNIIRYRSHSKRYILFEGTDLDIQSALVEAGNKISEVNDITTLLNKYFKFDIVFAKQYSFDTGTPRFFEFLISENAINKIPVGEIDGFINLIFNSKIKNSEIKEKSKNQEEAIIYCYFQNSNEIKNLLFEIEKINQVIKENDKDIVAKRELENIVESQIRLLNHYISSNIYNGSKEIKWFFKGEEKNISNKKDFNKLLTQVCNIVYHDTPIFKNELINKHNISPSVRTAKRNFFKALLNNWDLENLGFDETKFPPEKTIYMTMLKENGISILKENSIEIPRINKNSSFSKLWEESEKFLTSAKTEQIKISVFVEILSKRPFKLKKGLIDLWIPIYLFLRRNDFALFNNEGYIPTLSEENLELIVKSPEKYSLKTFDLDGVKLDIFNCYRIFLNQTAELKFNNISFIETIKPFIIFYKQLPLYSKQTKRLSNIALKIRIAIEISIDPEETFFKSFPEALGFSLNDLQNENSKLQIFTTNLQNAVRELRTSYEELINRFENYICSEYFNNNVDFEEYKIQFQNRFKNLKKHLLLSSQKTFIQRIDSKIEDKKAWLNSIAQALTGKTLESFTDEDEILLYEKFNSMILQLDSLTNISKIEINEETEDVIGVKIDTFFSSLDPKILRIPKRKLKEIELLQSKLKNKLGTSKNTNIVAVLNLLKELIQ